MSEAPVLERQASESRTIPERRVVVKDPAELPSAYSETPGGTIFSTTPGGTRIIYERHFLLQMRNSPLARSPPVKLARIPDIIDENVSIDLPIKPEPLNRKENDVISKNNELTETTESEVFSMD